MNGKSFTLRQAADLTDRSVDTLRRYYKDGKFPGAGPLPGDPTGTIHIPLQALVAADLLPESVLADDEPAAVIARKAAERERDAAHDELVALRTEKAALHRELARLLEEHDRLHRLLTTALKSRTA